LPLGVVVVAHAIRERKPPPPLITLAIALLAIGAPPGLPEPGKPINALTLIFGYGLPTIALAALCASDAIKRRGTVDTGS
jgi:hypothetical protein